MINIYEYASSLELGNIFVAPIINALSKTFALGTVSSNRIIDVVPAFVIQHQNNNYIISNSVIPKAGAIFANGKFSTLSSFAQYMGTDNTYKISIYRSINPNLSAFPLYTPPIKEGLKVFSIGPHMVPDIWTLKNNRPSLETAYNLKLGVADGIISKTTRNLTQEPQDSYIQHTVEMLGENNDFGPLFTIQNNTPYLLGINAAFNYLDANDPSYIGISFARPYNIIQSIIERLTA